MTGNNLIFDLDERGVATITLNRPDLHNAFNEDLIKELTDLFTQMEMNESIRLAVLTGSGKSFCSGADLSWMKKMKDYSQDENIQDSEKLSELFLVMNRFSRPLIGKVGGWALGGGVGLVAVCDYVIAVESAQLGLTEVRLGLVPAVIAPYVIAKIGESHARAYFLSGEKFSAQRAKEMGLVHRVCCADKIEANLEELIQEFLKTAPLASSRAKMLIGKVLSFQGGSVQNLQAMRDYTCHLISEMRVAPEGQEGMNALLEKRDADWSKALREDS